MLVLIMERLRCTCVQILPVWFASLRSEKSSYKEKCLRPFSVHGCYGNTVYQVSPLCVCWLEKWRSSHREYFPWPFFVDSRRGNSKIYMHTKFYCVLCKFEKWQSTFREKCLRPFLLMVVIEMQVYKVSPPLCCLQVWEVMWFASLRSE